MRFGQDVRVNSLCYRSWALWVLGYPEAALGDVHDALRDAREMSQAATLMVALFHAALPEIYCGNFATANIDELIALADEKGATLWKAGGTLARGWILALTGKPSDAVQTITRGLAAYQFTGTTVFAPLWLSCLTRAYAELGQFHNAWRSIGEAIATIEATKERWCEADIHRITGELALTSPEPDTAKAQASFERAISVAREQQAKSWELRAAVSMARLWRDQGKRAEARDLLAPVYGWFTEGFDTRDLKEARALLDELAA
jgi:predicted ATPase